MSLFRRNRERVPSEQACLENTAVLARVLASTPSAFRNTGRVIGAEVDRASQAMGCGAVYSQAGRVACFAAECPLQEPVDSPVADLS